MTQLKDARWQARWNRLRAFRRHHGHCRVPRNWPPDPELAVWVAHQRAARAACTLSTERVQALDRLGFDWSVGAAKWRRMLQRLEAFAAAEGHGNVPHLDPVDPELGHWLQRQRAAWHADTLPARRRRQLEGVGVVFDPRSERWSERVAELAAFRAAHGHSDVPQGYANRPLANWVAGVRIRLKHRRLTTAQVAQLEALGLGAVARVRHSGEVLWAKRFAELRAFQTNHGHCSPPKTTGGLYQWVQRQRRLQRAGALDDSKRAALEDLGLVWDRDAALWEEGFALLATFRAAHGHALGPFGLRTPRLTGWVHKQRRRKAQGVLEDARVKRLDALGFAWLGDRGLHDEDSAHLRELVEFRRRTGHFDLPDADPHRELFAWLQMHRRSGAHDTPTWRRLSDLHVPLLPREMAWEATFARVKAFADRRGAARLPPASQLGRWAALQQRRFERGTLEPFQEGRLSDLGLLPRAEQKRHHP